MLMERALLLQRLQPPRHQSQRHRSHPRQLLEVRQSRLCRHLPLQLQSRCRQNRQVLRRLHQSPQELHQLRRSPQELRPRRLSRLADLQNQPVGLQSQPVELQRPLHLLLRPFL